MTAPTLAWAGRLLSGVVAAFTALDAGLKLTGRPDLLEAGIAIPAPPALVGAGLLAATALYLLPRTALLGALLLTGALAASSALQADPSRLLFGVYVALLLWAGLVLRKPGLGRPMLRLIR